MWLGDDFHHNGAFRAGDVDLERVDGRVVEAPRDLGILLDRRAADVRDEPRFTKIERRQNLVHDMIDPGVLQADRVQHAGRRLPDAVRRIAEPRSERGALQHNGADRGVAEALDARVLLAEPDAARQQHDRRVELQTAKVEFEAAHAADSAGDDIGA
jgi:hypothetical protein